MFNNYVLLVARIMRNKDVKNTSFVQKFVEFNFVHFQLNYERIIRFRTLDMYV